jgi:hypothetical protein
MKTLSKQIEEIIKKNINAVPIGVGNTICGVIATTTEIQSLIESKYYEKEFVEWLQKECEGFNNGWIVYDISFNICNKFDTTEQAYQFWLTNIKGK